MSWMINDGMFKIGIVFMLLNGGGMRFVRDINLYVLYIFYC